MYLHATGADEPVPYTLTPKAHAALNAPIIWMLDECQVVSGYLAHDDEAAAILADLVSRGAAAGITAPDLNRPGRAPVDEWACEVCGAAYFGTPPDGRLCDLCRDAS
jgi:hypothetical protein